MLRFVACLKKRDDVSLYDFQRFWSLKTTSDLFDELVAAFAVSDMRIKPALQLEAQNELQQKLQGETDAFDCLVEIIWDDPSELARLYESREGEVLIDSFDRVVHDVVDRKGSTGFFTDYP